MKPQRFFIYSEAIKQNAMAMVNQIEPVGSNPMVVTVQESTRKLSQNAKLWAILATVSKRIEWAVRYPDGTIKQELLTSENWKDIFSASLNGEAKLAQDPNSNQMVLLGASTSRESVKWMSEMIELIYAFAANQGINLDE
jgi:hypothetical protein